MKILINATALTDRGSYTLIKDFIEEMKSQKESLKAKGITLLIFVAKEEFIQNIEDLIVVEYMPFPKKSLVQRLYFEIVRMPKILRKANAEAYLVLQNTSLYNGKIPQFVLIHQSLHFSDLKFNEFELKNYIKYKLLMNFFTRISIKRYFGIIVQTEWVKNALISKYKYKGSFKVVRPRVKSIFNSKKGLSKELQDKLKCEEVKLLCVTNKELYKNNERLVEAVKKYNVIHTDKKVKLFLTIEGTDQEDIIFCQIKHDEIFELYKAVDVLIFPSLVETLGLPLMEAMSINLPILVSELPYAKEVCGDYANYFNPRDIDSIIEAIFKFTKNNVELESKDIEPQSYFEYIEFIENSLNHKKS